MAVGRVFQLLGIFLGLVLLESARFLADRPLELEFGGSFHREEEASAAVVGAGRSPLDRFGRVWWPAVGKNRLV